MNLLAGALAELAECQRGLEDLREYQIKKLIPFLLENPKSAAYVDMGLGKTVSILTLLDILFWTNRMRRALIIAPLRVTVQTWPTEINEWRHLKWMSNYSLIRPDPSDPELAIEMAKARASDPLSPNHAATKARTAMFHRQIRRATQSESPIHLVNRELVDFLVQYWIEQRTWPYDTIVVDESTSFADHTSKRFKALSLVAQRTKRIHLLSGTPAPEGIQDLFAQCYLLDAGKRFGKAITPFKQKYLNEDQYTRKITPKEGAVEAVTAKMADICIVMKEDDYLPADKPLVFERPIVLEKHELRAYKEFEEDMLIEMVDGEVVEAVNNGVLSGKLLQYASGSLYGNLKFAEDGEKLGKTVHYIHEHKIEELRQIVEELPGEPLLVAYWFKPSLQRLIKAFPKATIMDKEGRCVDDWNAGKIPMLFVHPQSAGHGLNMQKGPGHIMVFFDTPMSLELYLQVIKRVARPGQKKRVKVIHLTTKKTLDEICVPRLRNKENAQDEVIAYLRKVRSKLLRRQA